ncbi:hypothetical protein HK096_002671, partial [Nowakowskiella sp. JEL0078]
MQETQAVAWDLDSPMAKSNEGNDIVSDILHQTDRNDALTHIRSYQHQFSPYFQPIVPKLAQIHKNDGGLQFIGGGGYLHPAGENLMSQVEKLKTMLREKDFENLKLRHENIERRKQKDIDQLTTQSEDAPRVIKGLREEVNNLKLKLREYFNATSTDTRQIRHLNEENRRLKDQNQKLEALALDKDLPTRETLFKEALSLREKLLEQEKNSMENAKRVELVEKNLSGENRQLRTKLHQMENEIIENLEKFEKLEDSMKEKEKEIASLSIYRYNAVHRKNDNACKQCHKREKEAIEFEKLVIMKDRFPEIKIPTISRISESSAKVFVTFPNQKNENDEILYTSLVLQWSDDIEMKKNLKQVEITQDSCQKKEDFSKIKSYTKSQEILLANSREFSDKKHNDVVVSQINAEQICIEISGLICGIYHYFQASLKIHNIESNPRRIDPLLIDLPANTPPKPTVNILTDTSTTFKSIEVVLTPPIPNGGSKPTKFRLYHSSDSLVADMVLLSEIDAITQNYPEILLEPTPSQVLSQSLTHTRSFSSTKYDFHHQFNSNELKKYPVTQIRSIQPIVFIYKTPTPCIPHYFSVSVINLSGESPRSQTSIPVVVDYAPSKPSMPIIKKINSSSVMLSCTCKSNGSEINAFRIAYFKIWKKIEYGRDESSLWKQRNGWKHLKKSIDVGWEDVNPSLKIDEIDIKKNNQSQEEVDKHEVFISASSFACTGKTLGKDFSFHQNFIGTQFQTPQNSHSLTSGNIKEFAMTINGLDPGKSYRFQVIALNPSGESEAGDLSDENVKINPGEDTLVPVPDSPEIHIITPTSIRIYFPNAILSGEQAPKITGFRVLVLPIEEGTNSPSLGLDTTTFVPSSLKSWTVEELTRGGQYYVSISFVGEREEGSLSVPIAVYLAAAIPLPNSPLQQSSSPKSTSPQPTIEAIHKQTSDSSDKGSNTSLLGSRLSLSEKVENMHQGMPANYIPSESNTGEQDVIDAAAVLAENQNRQMSNHHISLSGVAVSKQKQTHQQSSAHVS